MKVPIITNGKKAIYDIPVSWDQVSFGTMLEIPEQETDIIRIISILIKMDYDVLIRSKIVGFEELVHLLCFLREKPVLTLPKTILGYPMPKDLGFETVGQYKDLDIYVKEMVELKPMDQLRKYPLFCAVYACKHLSVSRCNNIINDLGLTGKQALELGHGLYDYRKAEAMANDFLKAPCTEVMSVGHFLLLKLIGLKHSIDPNSQKATSRMMSYRQVFKSWAGTLALIQRLFISKKRPVIKEVS